MPERVAGAEGAQHVDLEFVEDFVFFHDGEPDDMSAIAALVGAILGLGSGEKRHIKFVVGGGSHDKVAAFTAWITEVITKAKAWGALDFTVYRGVTGRNEPDFPVGYIKTVANDPNLEPEPRPNGQSGNYESLAKLVEENSVVIVTKPLLEMLVDGALTQELVNKLASCTLVMYGSFNTRVMFKFMAQRLGVESHSPFVFAAILGCLRMFGRVIYYSAYVALGDGGNDTNQARDPHLWEAAVAAPGRLGPLFQLWNEHILPGCVKWVPGEFVELAEACENIPDSSAAVAEVREFINAWKDVFVPKDGDESPDWETRFTNGKTAAWAKTHGKWEKIKDDIVALIKAEKKSADDSDNLETLQAKFESLFRSIRLIALKSREVEDEINAGLLGDAGALMTAMTPGVNRYGFLSISSAGYEVFEAGTGTPPPGAIQVYMAKKEATLRDVIVATMATALSTLARKSA